MAINISSNNIQTTCKNLFKVGGVNLVFPATQCLPNQDSNTKIKTIHSHSFNNSSNNSINTSPVNFSNPYYDKLNNTSYWTYILTNIFQDNKIFETISEIYIPININISLSMINVEEKILAYGFFRKVPFDFLNPPSINAEANIKYLRIMVSDSYSEGNSSTYRISIIGNYPEKQSQIYVNVTNNIQETITNNLLRFEKFTYAAAPTIPNISIIKKSKVIIDDKEIKIKYKVLIANTGSVDLNKLSFTDYIMYDEDNIYISRVILKNENITNSYLNNGKISIIKNIETLPIGESIELNYEVPIDNILNPNRYNFNSFSKIKNLDFEKTLETSEIIEAVKLQTNLFTTLIDENTFAFGLTLKSTDNSPDCAAIVENIINIPKKITIKFLNFNGSLAYFDDTLEPVPLFTDISGRTIKILSYPILYKNNIVTYLFKLRIFSYENLQLLASNNSLNNFNSLFILNILNDVQLINNNQYFIGAFPLPLTSSVSISGVLIPKSNL